MPFFSIWSYKLREHEDADKSKVQDPSWKELGVLIFVLVLVDLKLSVIMHLKQSDTKISEYE